MRFSPALLPALAALLLAAGCTSADVAPPPQPYSAEQLGLKAAPSSPTPSTSAGGTPSTGAQSPGVASSVVKATHQPAGAALVSSSYGDVGSPKTLGRFEAFLGKDVNAFWGKTFHNSGLTWRPVPLVIVPPGGQLSSGCRTTAGAAVVAGDPDETRGADPAFECPTDATVYVSTDWLLDHVWFVHVGQTESGTPVLRRGGDLGVAIVIAHEIGHAVQRQLHIELPADATSVRPLELQADCYAGIWAYAKFASGELDTTRIRSALESEEDVGDFGFDDFQHHGTPDERVAAFHAGYDSGDPQKCPLDVGAAAAGGVP